MYRRGDGNSERVSKSPGPHSYGLAEQGFESWLMQSRAVSGPRPWPPLPRENKPKHTNLLGPCLSLLLPLPHSRVASISSPPRTPSGLCPSLTSRWEKCPVTLSFIVTFRQVSVPQQVTLEDLLLVNMPSSFGFSPGFTFAASLSVSPSSAHAARCKGLCLQPLLCGRVVRADHLRAGLSPPPAHGWVSSLVSTPDLRSELQCDRHDV